MRNGENEKMRNWLCRVCAQPNFSFSHFLIFSISSFFLIFLISILFSCDKATDTISRRYPCRFIFDGQQHPTSLVFAAVKSPGTYVYVTTTGDGRTTARHVYVTLNDGKTPREDNVIRTDRENYSAFQLGASNDIGLFIGCTNFNGPVAYDRACPNCVSLTALDFAGNRQQVHCSKCNRTYDLETSAIITGGEGEPLMRYAVTYNGTILTVGN